MRYIPGFEKPLFYCSLLTLLFIVTPSDAHDFPKREMRAVWIATVHNIDWPSKPGLTTEEQQTEMIRILDKALEYNLNTVVFQIRPAADAFYNSQIEPWSKWLSGRQGVAPDPYYDPLQFTIEQCRKRGLDIHVWLNPYRALTDTTDTASVNHITRIHPDWFVKYGNTVYFDPGLPQIRDYMASVVSDIVRRYDIDAIHMDDYFYPYRIANMEFPDDSSFVKYPRGFTADLKEDWRRDNVNLIIRQLHDSIKSIKPYVELGISPFGVWRNSDKDPAGSATRAGQTNYDDLYADILKWQKEGWIDYVVPQIYWHIGMEVADYAVISEWWSHNTYGCQLYVGQAPYRIDRKSGIKEWRRSGEIIKQIGLNRTCPNISGSMFFSARVLERNPLRMKEKMLREVFRYPAVTPVNILITPVVPAMPSDATISRNDNMISLTWKRGPETRNFIIYRFKRGEAADMNNPENILRVTSDEVLSLAYDKRTDPQKYFYVITSQSYTNLESAPVYFEPGEK